MGVLNLVREAWLGVRDHWSPEMKEARDLENLAELQRLGPVRYAVRRVALYTATLEIWPLLRFVDAFRQHGWAFNRGDIVGFALFTAGVSVIFGSVSVRREIKRLRQTYESEPLEEQIDTFRV